MHQYQTRPCNPTYTGIFHFDSGVEDDDGEGRNVPLGDECVAGDAVDLGFTDDDVGSVQRVHQQRGVGDEGLGLGLVLEDRDLLVEVWVVPDVSRRLLGELQLHDAVLAPDVKDFKIQFNFSTLFDGSIY